MKPILFVALCLPVLAGVAGAQPAKQIFGRAGAPAAEWPAEAVGGYSRGCLAGAVRLSADNPGWQVMKPGRNRFWGHPELIAFVSRLSQSAVAAGWNGILTGDLSQPRGGPMLSGHASHQIGLDADIWMRPAPDRRMSEKERNAASSVSVVTADERRVNSHWTDGHRAVLQAASLDAAVTRIFVNPAIKQHLCESLPANERGWLRKIRPWWGHSAHFHVRLSCPAGSQNCVNQPPPPAGDGCDASLAWWFSDEARAPAKPSAKPKPELTLAELPAACAAISGR